MRVFSELPRLPLQTDCALTVGTFDGVHRGHAALIETLKSEAARRGLRSRVLTFQDMPFCYFKPDDCPRLLSLPAEKQAAFEPLQIDDLLLVPFDASIAEQPAEEFVREQLVGRLRARLLVVGPDFALGKDRAGDVTALRALGKSCGFEVVVLQEKLRHDSQPISSTRTREAVERGDVAQAALLLGQPFEMEGEVVGGRQLGRTIDVPTINLRLHARKVLPANGVYAVRAHFNGQAHRAALNIGTRPTVSGENISIEFHVIDEDIPFAPPRARLQLVERLRDEQKFPDLPSLVQQMQRDIARARELL